MKKIFVLLIIFSITSSIYCQDALPTQTKEYASVYLKILYQGNVIQYDKKGWSKSPMITLPNGVYSFLYNESDKSNIKEFKLLNEVLNYMASYGWEMKSIAVLPYSGGTGSSQNGGDLVNTSVYIEEIIFERTIKK
jgi:hypothetical protein